MDKSEPCQSAALAQLCCALGSPELGCRRGAAEGRAEDGSDLPAKCLCALAEVSQGLSITERSSLSILCLTTSQAPPCALHLIPAPPDCSLVEVQQPCSELALIPPWSSCPGQGLHLQGRMEALREAAWADFMPVPFLLTLS